MTSYGSIQGNTSPSNTDLHETTPLVNGRNDSNNEHISTKCSYWSKLTFHWFTPVLYRGNEKLKLDQDDLDLVPLLNDCETDYVTNTFDMYWGQELQKDSPCLVTALTRAFGAEYLEGAALKLVHDLCLFVGPQVLHSMIVFLRDPDAPLIWGLWLIFAVTISQLAMSICLRHYFYKVSDLRQPLNLESVPIWHNSLFPSSATQLDCELEQQLSWQSIEKLYF